MNAHSQPVNVQQIFDQVKSDLAESGLKWYTEDDIYASMQEAYNKIVALLCPIEKTTFLPQIASPYYDFAKQIPDFMYVAGIYNPLTLLWLLGNSYKLMKATYQTYLAIGNHQYYDIIDMRKVLLWPYSPAATGTIFVVYKASAPKFYIPPVVEGGQGMYDPDHIPLLPYSVALPLIEYFTVADLMEQAREFSKARIWWDKLLVKSTLGRSVWEQAKLEIKDLARVDRETVLEPFRWIFHGGASGNVNWINNEIPDGDIDGTNTVFTLAQIPNPSASVLLMKNGQVLFQGVGYNLNGATITFETDYIPQPATDTDPVGDSLRAWYQVQ